jgi:ribosomal protein L7/L12
MMSTISVWAITDPGLKQARDLVDAVPQLLKEHLPREEAEVLKNKRVEAGGVVTLRPQPPGGPAWP